MAIYFQNREIKDIYYQNKPVKFVYRGSNIVYGSFDPVKFYPTGQMQHYAIPQGVSQIDIICNAAQGRNIGGAIGGRGGQILCRAHVKYGQTLRIWVGPQQNNENANWDNSSYIAEGDNRAGLFCIAGGGGSAYKGDFGYFHKLFNGGAGGGLTGGAGQGDGTPGQGGTQTEGGNGASVDWGVFHADGHKGQKWLGGDSLHHGSWGIGAGGGAGWFGGGGAAYAVYAAGTQYDGLASASAGGGSSWTDGNRCFNVQHHQGVQDGNGFIQITPVL